VSKPLDDYTVADSPAFGNLIHRGANGYWKPIYPNEVGRALKHVEADFNYKLLTSSLANYRIYPGGQLPSNNSNIEDFSADQNKVLTLKKDGTTFYWTLEVAQGGGGSGLYESNLDSTIETVSDFGGIDAGTTVADLDGQTISSILDTLLFPTSYPTKTNPSTSLTALSGLQIVGSSATIQFGTTANRGSINLNSQFQDFYAGAVTAAQITGPGGPYNLTIGPGASQITPPSSFQHTVVLGTSSNRWTLTTDFSQGPMPEDSTGSPFPSIRYNGGSASNSHQFEGVYPIFIGNASNGYDQANNLVSFSWSTNLDPNSNSYPNINTDQTYGESGGVLHHRISIPSDLINGRTVEIWKYSSAANAYLEATSAWATQTTTRTIELNSVSYVDFTKSGDVGGSNQYRIKFT